MVQTTHLNDYFPDQNVPPDDIDQCEIISGEITDTVGTVDGVKFIENELLIELENCCIDAEIDNFGNLIINGCSQDIQGYFIDHPEAELKFCPDIPRLL